MAFLVRLVTVVIILIPQISRGSSASLEVNSNVDNESISPRKQMTTLAINKNEPVIIQQQEHSPTFPPDDNLGEIIPGFDNWIFFGLMGSFGIFFLFILVSCCYACCSNIYCPEKLDHPDCSCSPSCRHGQGPIYQCQGHIHGNQPHTCTNYNRPCRGEPGDRLGEPGIERERTGAPLETPSAVLIQS